MATLTPEHAARVALAAFASGAGADPSNPTPPGPVTVGAPLHVERLDRPGRSYFLVPIEEASGIVGVVQVGGEDGQIEQAARLRAPATRLHLSSDEALAAAAQARPELRGWGTPFLGWRPCTESFDSMAPFWVIPHAAGRVHIDIRGRVHGELGTGGRGG